MTLKVYAVPLLLSLLCHLVVAKPGVSVLPNKLHNGPLTAETVSGSGSLDGMKLSSTANVSSYEWWYFDAVSTSSKNESIDIVFFNNGPKGFPFGYVDGPLSLGLSGSLANGTLFSFKVPVTHKAIFIESDEGIEADWKGTGGRFVGSTFSRPNIVYEVTVDNPNIGVCGTLQLRSVAPPRYTCDPDVPDTNELAWLNVGWSNAIPDSDATVDFSIGGSTLKFTGSGYHDKNWGLSPFTNDANHTYWGHARVGPYSVVFSDGLIPDGANKTKELFSATVAKDGEFVELSCAKDAIVVRPWGGNDEYPPVIGLSPPLGTEITFQLGYEGILRLNVTNDLILVNQPNYQRFIGTVEGRANDGPAMQGRVLWEQFDL